MGIDFLDFSFRIEKSFGIKIRNDDYDWFGQTKKRDLTAGNLHFWVVHLCVQQGFEVPYSSWHRVKLELAKTTGKSPRIINPQTLIVRDLGFD